MPNALPKTFADAYAVVSTDLMTQIGDALAAESGPPAATEVRPATERIRMEAWNQAHPEATDEAMWGLAQQRYAEHRQAGMDDQRARRAVAEDLTHFKYRARMPLYTLGTTRWTEQVKEAERLARRSERERALSSSHGAQSTPEGPLPGTVPEPEPILPPQPTEPLLPTAPPQIPDLSQEGPSYGR
jgi:hypothetical protein